MARKYVKKDLENAAKDLNKVCDLDPSIVIGDETTVKELEADIKDVFENVLEKDDKLTKETEKTLGFLGLNRSSEIDLPDEKLPDENAKEKPESKKEVKKEVKEEVKKPEVKNKGIGAFVRDGLQDGSFKGMKNKEIAELVKEKFNSNTRATNISWYKSKLKKQDIKIDI